MTDSLSSFQQLAKTFETVDWIVPPYIQMGFLRNLANEIDSAKPDDKLQLLETGLAALYNEEILSVMLLVRYCKTPHVKDFKTPIAEAIEAAHLGLFHISVATLTTVLEGVIRKIAQARGGEIGNGTQKLVEEIKHLISAERSSAHYYHERVVMLEAFQGFLENRLLKHTSEYAGSGNLNRHGILHGIFNAYGHHFNFYRMISFLDLLCFTIACSTSGISLFAPDITEESKRLATYYRSLNALQSVALTMGARL